MHGAKDATPMSLWDTGSLTTGWSGWFRFKAAGTYPYHDPADAGLTGSIRVPITVSPGRGTPRSDFTVTWASSDAAAGYAYDIQIKRPDANRWRDWRSGVRRAEGSFTPDGGRGTYRFRARLVSQSGGHSRWSPTDRIRIG
jgi:hypothetical protein